MAAAQQQLRDESVREYSCASVGSDVTDAYMGGPMYRGAIPDRDERFPAGCVAVLPMCSPSYPASETCKCAVLDMNSGFFEWQCQF